MSIHDRHVYFPPFTEKEAKAGASELGGNEAAAVFLSRHSFSPSSFQIGLSAMQAFHSCSLSLSLIFFNLSIYFNSLKQNSIKGLCSPLDTLN